MKISKICKLALLTTVISGAAMAAEPLPVVNSVTVGNVDFTKTADSLLIKQHDNFANTNYDSFDIGAGKSVKFDLPSKNAVSINNVTGSARPSVIAGSLEANQGHVALRNPYGITITNSGVIKNTDALMFTTANNMEYNAASNTVTLSDFGNGKIINKGQITSKNNGLVTFIGNDLSNTGKITANEGRVVFEAAKKVNVQLVDGFNYLYSEAYDANAPVNTKMSNSGTITARSGFVEFTDGDVSKIRQSVMNLGGVFDVNPFETKPYTGQFSATSSGDINFSGRVESNGKGGPTHIIAGNNLGYTGTINAFSSNSQPSVNIAGKGFAYNGNINTNGNVNIEIKGNLNISDGSAKTSPKTKPKAFTEKDFAKPTITQQQLEKIGQTASGINIKANGIRIADLKDNELNMKSGIALNAIQSSGKLGGITMQDKNDTIASAKSVYLQSNNGDINVGNIQSNGWTNLYSLNNGVSANNIDVDLTSPSNAGPYTLQIFAGKGDINVGNVNVLSDYTLQNGGYTYGTINMQANGYAGGLGNINTKDIRLTSKGNAPVSTIAITADKDITIVGTLDNKSEAVDPNKQGRIETKLVSKDGIIINLPNTPLAGNAQVNKVPNIFINADNNNVANIAEENFIIAQ